MKKIIEQQKKGVQKMKKELEIWFHVKHL
jgi:hypothetical protein